MMIFSFLFLLLTIAFYAVGYTLATLVVVFLLSLIPKLRPLRKIFRNKYLIFTCIISLIAYGVIFLCYCFSYWHNVGYEDSARIPIGNNFEIISIDNQECYFKDQSGIDVPIDSFAISRGILCANFKRTNTIDSLECKDCFFVFDTNTQQQYIFNYPDDYEKFAKQSSLPSHKNFKDFRYNYNKYWERNSYWYLP
ncbi:hypothetical protein ACI6Q2_18965 [Chitinophagaceae bacterium LWZ2-11]